MAGGGGGGGGDSGGYSSGAGYGGSTGAIGAAIGMDFGGMGGMAAGLSGTSGEFVGWRDILGRLHPWEIDPGDPFGIPRDLAGYELQGNNLVDTRGYFDPRMAGGPGVNYARNSAVSSAMIPDARGGQTIDPRFVGLAQRAEGQASGVDARAKMGALAAGPWSGFNR